MTALSSPMNTFICSRKHSRLPLYRTTHYTPTQTLSYWSTHKAIRPLFQPVALLYRAYHPWWKTLCQTRFVSRELLRCSWHPKLRRWKDLVKVYLSLLDRYGLSTVQCHVSRENRVWKNSTNPVYYTTRYTLEYENDGNHNISSFLSLLQPEKSNILYSIKRSFSHVPKNLTEPSELPDAR